MVYVNLVRSFVHDGFSGYTCGQIQGQLAPLNTDSDVLRRANFVL